MHKTESKKKTKKPKIGKVKKGPKVMSKSERKKKTKNLKPKNFRSSRGISYHFI